MKTIFNGLIFLILGIGLVACAGQPAEIRGEAFELYLLADDQAHGMDIIDTPLEDLELAETPLLTTADLISYERSTHTLELTDAGFQKVTDLLEAGFQVAGIPFVVVSGGERIYAGAFWTPLSSQSFDGVVIMDPAFQSDDNTIQITVGYPGSGFFTGADPREDSRLLAALDAAGVLK
ncbi:MAG: hypothetical protein H0S82_00765 [Anaerolineaceae bacterium]|nr:hypothetical protein [Anaerolineaceae bacterium]